MHDQAESLREMINKDGRGKGSKKQLTLFPLYNPDEKQTEREEKGLQEGLRVIAVTSGKGGVGKTNVVANLAYVMTKLGKKVLVLDADLGLGSLDVLLGLAPKYHIGHLLSGERGLDEIIVRGPNDMMILPASSGIQELTSLSDEQKLSFVSEFDQLKESVDVLLIDTGAGISSNVLYFSTAAQEIIVVVSPEPTSITDAYAIMKVLSLNHGERRFKLLVNLVKNSKEGLDIYNNLCTVADKYLDISIDLLGSIPYDKNLRKAVMAQKLVTELFPDSKASEEFLSVARTILSSEQEKSKGSIQFLWERVIGGESAKQI